MKEKIKETLHRRVLKPLLPNKTMRLTAQQELISNKINSIVL